MHIMFYKASEGTILDKFIGFWTLGPYSHCEIYFDSLQKGFSARLETNTCSFKDIHPNDHRFDSYEIPVTVDPRKVMDFCLSVEGKEYDWSGIIFNFLIPISEHSRRRYFCSEVCTKALQAGGLDLPIIPHKTSPNSLFYTLLSLKHLVKR